MSKRNVPRKTKGPQSPGFKQLGIADVSVEPLSSTAEEKLLRIARLHGVPEEQFNPLRDEITMAIALARADYELHEANPAAGPAKQQLDEIRRHIDALLEDHAAKLLTLISGLPPSLAMLLGAKELHSVAPSRGARPIESQPRRT